MSEQIMYSIENHPLALGLFLLQLVLPFVLGFISIRGLWGLKTKAKRNE